MCSGVLHGSSNPMVLPLFLGDGDVPIGIGSASPGGLTRSEYGQRCERLLARPEHSCASCASSTCGTSSTNSPSSTSRTSSTSSKALAVEPKPKPQSSRWTSTLNTSIALDCIALHYIALCCVALHGIGLQCIVLRSPLAVALMSNN